MAFIKHTLALILLALIGLPFNASAEQFGDYKTHGFLSDYSKLEPEGGDSDAYVYRNPEQLGKYNKLMIDRIKIYLKEDAQSKEIDPAELKELVDYFHQAIVDKVSQKYPIVNEAGPDVLRLRIAITDLVPNKPEASMVTLVVPFLWVGEAGAGAKEGEVGSTPFVGEATIEMEAMDSASNQQIAAYIETETAKKYKWDQGIGEGIDAYTKAYSTWAYTKKAMDDWAKLIRERMDATH